MLKNCEVCAADSSADTVHSLAGESDILLANVSGFLGGIFNTDGFPPRWECGTGWTPGLGWLHIGSDFAIFGAYFAIPLVLAFFALRRRDVPFPPVLWLFVAFIALCGMGHLVEGTIFWTPWYRLSGLIKGMTAVVSWVTVIALIRIAPVALRFPGMAKLNSELNREVSERQKIESSLRTRADELERMNEELAYVERATMGREDRIVRLKEEVNELLARLGESPRYQADFSES